ncbi:laminin subunit alpha-2-like [Anopheles marshallii]|uniref:laminin subunit alpha-2-like n=1 Tax=Anopheles marshallii TaxID=1521116 RepID=UPI00237B9278|nr:laminin subunit alpha-2-like [Anopheles marshallii]
MYKFLVTFLGVFIVFSVCWSVHCSNVDDVLLEYENFNMEVMEGKRLKLLFHYGHRHLRNPKWYFNGRPISKTRCTANYGELVCPAVQRNDSGRYDLWAVDGSEYSQARLMFSVIVQVIKSAEHDLSELIIQSDSVQAVESFTQPLGSWNDCFCSGVTSRCRMASDLYRTRNNFNLSNAIPETTLLLESETKEENYLKIPSSVWIENLITAYGGYLRFPVTDECYINRSKPCILLFDKRNKHRAIGYYLSPSHDQRPVQILMKESNWRLVSTKYERDDRIPEDTINKFIFMSTLSNIKAIYIRGRYRTLENNIITIEMATLYDDGLGKVTTVEDCSCHPGYGGLSCEICNKGYVRMYESVNPNGICVSILELWKLYNA